MDEALKKRLRTTYRLWMDACPHCGKAQGELAREVFKEAVQQAVAHVNTLAVPPEWGELRFTEGHFPYDLAAWSGGFMVGVMHADEGDGQEAAWYWNTPGDRSARFCRSPEDALICLVEKLEERFGPKVGSGAAEPA